MCSAFTDLPEPKIYVACLAAYNAGHLHGRWIDATQDPEDIQAEITAMLSMSPESDAEEWAIHDYEGFGKLALSEYEGIERVAALAAFITQQTRFGAELLAHFGGDLQDAQNALENYAGEYRSLAEFAQEITEETTTIPQSLAFYIDYEAMARDMELNGDIFTCETGFEQVHVFWNR